MLKPAKMQKVRIIGLKTIVSELIKLLHELGLVEITVSDYEGLEGGRPLEFYNDVSEQLVKIRAIKNILIVPKLASIEKMGGSQALDQAKLLRLDEEIKLLNEELSRNESELTKINDQIKTVSKLSGFKDIDFSKLNTNTVSYIIGYLPSDKFEKEKTKFDQSIKNYNIRFSSDGKNSLALIVYRKGNFDIGSVLSDFNFTEIQIPEFLSFPQVFLEHLNSESKKTAKLIEDVRHKLSQLSSKNYSKIASIERALTIEADRAEIASRFSSTASLYIIEGWIKASDFGNLEASLTSRFKDNISIEAPSFDSHHDLPPTVLDNPKSASPFEFLTRSYSLPNSQEIDPTIFYLIAVPLLYGMIVGDVGYGILSILISKFIMNKFKSSYILSNVSKIWFLSAFPSIIFGLIFDEWMGAPHIYWFDIFAKWGLDFGIQSSVYYGLSRIHDLTTVIGITCLVGLVHLGLGFILGAINEWSHSKKHAIAKISWLGVEIGGTIVVASAMLNLITADYLPFGGILLAISAIVLAFTEGVVGILELPGLAGNVLSYTRIAAIGVVGVILAEIINEFMIPLPEQGIFGLLLVPLLLVMHAINTFIAMFESLIQGGRLNILEFRSKFLKGGGKPFEPFVVDA